jgi:hypothetical protein
MFIDVIDIIIFLVVLGLLIAIPAVIILRLLNRANKHTHKAAFDDFVMKSEVTHSGLNIPASAFGDANEVEIYKGKEGVLVKIVSRKDSKQ